VVGAWVLDPEFEIPLANGGLDYVNDPKIVLNAKCSNGVLSGQVSYYYVLNNQRHKNLDHTDAVSGSCTNGQAQFAVNFVAISDYHSTSTGDNSYSINTTLQFQNIEDQDAVIGFAVSEKNFVLQDRCDKGVSIDPSNGYPYCTR
jgi:hypothetical protein